MNKEIKIISPEFLITYKQSREVEKILLSNKPNISLYLEKYNVIIQKAYDHLDVKRESAKNGYSFVIEKPELVDNDFFYANLLSDTSNRNITLSDYPLTIRSFKVNDKYKIKDYEVLVRRLFIDWKMPMSMRGVWPIVINKDGKIIYSPRYQKDFAPDENTNFYVKECFTLK